MGKLNISMAIFNSYVNVYQRVVDQQWVNIQYVDNGSTAKISCSTFCWPIIDAFIDDFAPEQI